MKKPIQYCLVILTAIVLSSCIKNEVDHGTIYCDPGQPIALFRVVDKTTGVDLFFSDNPKYQLKDIIALKKKDETHTDTIKLEVFGNVAERVFILPLDYSKSENSIIIRIAGTPDDVFNYIYEKTNNPCESSKLVKANFNNVEPIRKEGVFIFQK